MRADRPERTRPGQGPRERTEGAPFAERTPRTERAPRKDIGPRSAPEPGMETYRIEVGHRHGVKPGNIVGAIANEADLESRYIGRIDIHDDHSILDLPEGMPRELLAHLKKVRVAGQPLQLHRVGEGGAERPAPRPRAPHRKGPNNARPPKLR